ncbi:DUF4214 domain-containing protein [Marivita sp. S6314]|uniref:DUF4214 domain-containing protein n=1 Tax=Marivita sp. S6314 TaxID=2926406 RepID=UPI001FF5FAAC|nr:DUF4214 domain-containing protein [Marivita sp. S6314]MCK0149801.1 DUF4214 domain-containing protein [Marivita sp. S6314]
MEPVTDVFGTQTSAAAMGFGLNGVTDWSVQQPFLDVFKTARPWMIHTEDQWGAYSPEQLASMGALDADGWIMDIPSDVDRIQTVILTELPQDATYTAGLYRLSYDGNGSISVSGAEIVSQTDGEIWFDYQPTGSGMVWITVDATDPANYLRNISVVKQEHIPAFEAGQVFNPLWLDVIDNAHSLRFMDWMETNDSTLQSWSERPHEAKYTYFGGVPVEVMVDLANATGTEPWFNIPWHADETFIREFSTYVRDNLDPDLRAHFEMSNEVWNWMFEQAQDASQAAQQRFGQELGDGWVQEYGARSAEMAAILDQVYAGQEHLLVKAIATHTFWPGLETAILEAPAWQAQNAGNDAPFLSFDTYAITGYFGNSFGTDAKANAVLQWVAQSESQARQDAAAQGLSGAAADAYVADHRYDAAVDLAIRELRDGSVTGDAEDSLQGLFELFRYHKSVADAHGLDLVMYEGGTHIVGVGPWVDNDTLTDFFLHLNYSDEMGHLYEELLAGWEAAGGTLFNAFVDVARPSQWGSWGSLRHLEDDTGRHRAIDDFIDRHPAPDHMKDGLWNSVPQDFAPVPSPDPDPQPDPEPDPTPTPEPTPDPEPFPDPDPDPTPPVAPTDPVADVREYIFGNSLIAWAVGDPELSVTHWTAQMAASAGSSYAAAMQTGMLSDHDDLPARPHINMSTVTEALDPDGDQSFADVGFTQITISASNFVQYQAPDEPYWGSSDTSPAEAAMRVINWASDRAPGATINIFETWPEMEGFAASFPPTEAEFAAWQNYMLGDWHDWWVSLSETINRQRPDLDVRLISVGPQIAAMLDDPSLGLTGMTVQDLYQDDAPHGTPTLYFLASLVHYSAIYGSAPPSNFAVPNTVHPAVRDNFNDIVNWLAEAGGTGLPEPLVAPFSDRSEDLSAGESDVGSNAIETPVITTSSDGIIGQNGDDRIVLQTGNTAVDGRGGEDTLVLAGNQANYSVRFLDDTIVVENRSDPDELPVALQNMEWLDFGQETAPFDARGVDLDLFDGMASLDAAAVAALTELYIAYFNRAPDAVGLFFWGNQLANGRSLTNIAEQFFDQPETRAVYGDLTDTDAFVTAVYQNVLGRSPDSGGMAFWMDVLESGSGTTPATFIQAIIAGAKADTGAPQDAAYLANKVLVGTHYAVTRGMSDVEDASAVMLGFDGTSTAVQQGIAATDALYSDILDGTTDGFLMQLVGLSDDPFTL